MKKTQETQTDKSPTPKDERANKFSLSFIGMVEQQFKGRLGATVGWSDEQKVLAQNIFLKVDEVLRTLEADRNGGTPFTWENINAEKLALDTVHRVNLGLDALIKNHIHPVPYFNKKSIKYDIDLRVGFEGMLYSRKVNALADVVDIVVELVHKNDQFTVYKRGINNEIESYDFNIVSPFDRGDVIGGFGYVAFENPKQNFLVVLSEEDFLRSKNFAQSKKFWDAHPKQMRFKTIAHRVCERITIDPAKSNSWHSSIADEIHAIEATFSEEYEQNANQSVLPTEEESVTIAVIESAQSEPEEEAVAVMAEKDRGY